eukprot:gnl/TRDRNA2_/TRDRNA2_81890_c0_seq1.p1 gnl/TRDRNA2_/TRDRNA2_81890_c0~~gnl/TRDRNA2_/TRDRNA2_81890_c0_seq1.p1  ORF type:complete len:135 (+),score=23.70 gnl/TRDRNA2_/TRDRNA2_81890_c0_seq1:127-531(+)
MPPTEKYPQMWEIVGGVGRGGVLVRTGQELGSPQADGRLSTGAIVEQIELVGERLHYKRRAGTGPKFGWISIFLSGRDLALKTLAVPPPDNPAEEASPPPPPKPKPEPAPAGGGQPGPPAASSGSSSSAVVIRN